MRMYERFSRADQKKEMAYGRAEADSSKGLGSKGGREGEGTIG
jgi:hypothetical protein